MSEAAEISYYRFTSEALPERERIEVWREVFGRAMIRLEMEPVGEGPFYSDAYLHALPGVAVSRVSTSAFLGTRSPALIDDGRSEIGVLAPLDGRMAVSQGGREAVLEAGAAVILRTDRPGAVQFPAATSYANLCISESALKPLVGDLDAVEMKVIPADNAPLRLLLGYANTLAASALAPSLHAVHMIADHLRDLTAASIGLVLDGEAGGERGALGAARLSALKRDIARHAGDGELTIEKVARRQGISPSYVRKLLAGEGTSFSGFLLERRLALAHRTLREPAFAHRSISAIAYGCGFGDLSYFNRTFRRRYGVTPSEIRASVRDSEPQ